MFTRIAAGVAGLAVAVGIVAGAATLAGPVVTELAAVGPTQQPHCLMCPDPGFSPK